MTDVAKAVERHDVAEIVARRPTASPHRRFNIVLIKTSHYDDDGYVVMVADCAVRIVLGRDVTINLTAIDETNKRLNCEKLTAERRSPTSSRARSTLRDCCGPPGFPFR